MFPINDHNPSERVAWVNWALIAANVAVFLLTWPQMSGPEAAAFDLDWALVPARVSAGEGYAGFVTSVFLHAGPLHLAGNMLFLHIFGDNMEDQFGPLPYLGFYLVCGIAAGLAQYLSEPQSAIPMVGASGAISGVMGAYLLLFPKARVDVLIILVVIVRIVTIPAVIVLGLWFAVQVGSGAMAPAGDVGGVAYMAHIGGFLAGLALCVPLWLRLGGTGFWRRSDGAPPHPETIWRRR